MHVGISIKSTLVAFSALRVKLAYLMKPTSVKILKSGQVQYFFSNVLVH